MTFQQEAQANGFAMVPDYLPVNQFTRFAGIGKKSSNRAGWAVRSETDLVTYGDFSSGAQFIYVPENSKPMTEQQKRELKQRIEQERAKAEAEKLKVNIQAHNEVNQLWQTAFEALVQHPYTLKKGIATHGAKIVTDGPFKNALMIPIIGTQQPFLGVMQSAQYIFPDGQKRFHSGGKKAGGFWEIQWIEDAPIVICEGFATGATLAKHYCPEFSVLCAFDAGNLKAVAVAFREANPKTQMIIAGDNDWQTEQQTGFNPGKEKAIQAAQAVNGLVSIPTFADDETGSDWNDRYLLDFKK